MSRKLCVCFTSNEANHGTILSHHFFVVCRTHHWSPLKKEVDFITTTRDQKLALFDCAKDRHIFPWVDVNARFGFIKYRQASDMNDPEH